MTKCRIIINNRNDKPEKWIADKAIKISPFNQDNTVKDLSWLESSTGIYHRFTSLVPGDEIFVFVKLNLKYKFIVASNYNYEIHGYFIKGAFRCKNTVYFFKNKSYEGKGNNRWQSFNRERIDEFDQLADWEQIELSDKIYNVLGNLPSDDEVENDIYTEGQISEETIKVGKRNPKLKKYFFETHEKKCSLCGKVYKKADGISPIIDLHHLHQISFGIRNVDPKDLDKYLMALCPNCHRWVHSIKSDHELTAEEIKEIYKHFIEKE